MFLILHRFRYKLRKELSSIFTPHSIHIPSYCQLLTARVRLICSQWLCWLNYYNVKMKWTWDGEKISKQLLMILIGWQRSNEKNTTLSASARTLKSNQSGGATNKIWIFYKCFSLRSAYFCLLLRYKCGKCHKKWLLHLYLLFYSFSLAFIVRRIFF